MYLQLNMSGFLKFVMTKFRFGVSDIATHSLRYKNAQSNCFLCPLCKNANEDEVHFVLVCPFFSNLRKSLIAEKYHRSPNSFRLTLLLASTHEKTVRNLCAFLYKAFKARETALT